MCSGINLSLCIILLVASFVIKVKATDHAYDDTKTQIDTATHETIKNQIIAVGEERYHTSNEFSITIDSIKTQSLLTVLEVKDVYYYIGSKNKKSEAWYKFNGIGEYAVNMNFAEIIVDEERKLIYIKIPEPILKDDIKIETQEYYFEKHLFDSVADGVEIAREAELEARDELEKSIKNNLDYYEYAKRAAKEQIIELVKKFNPDIEIKVEVEFF